MDHSQRYERVIPVKMKGRQLLTCVILYSIYLAVFLAGTVLFLLTMQPAAAVLTVLGTLLIFLATKSLLRAEFEYSFFGGTLTVSKIYGRSRRKQLAELSLDSLLLVDYDTPSGFGAASGLKPTKTLIALSAPSASPALILVWENEQGERTSCTIEADERTETILRRAKPEACSYDVKRGIRPSTDT